MAWLAVDFDGMEYVFASKPIRNKTYNCWQLDDSRLLLDVVDLPKGSIKKLIGRGLSFDDKPVELKGE